MEDAENDHHDVRICMDKNEHLYKRFRYNSMSMTVEVGAAEWLQEVQQDRPDADDVSRLLTASDQDVRGVIRRLGDPEKNERLEILKHLKLAEQIRNEY